MKSNASNIKNIKAMTMVHNDRFLPKWVEYYSSQLGKENLIVFFDGLDQVIPEECKGIECIRIPKMKGDVVATDHQRSRFMSEQAAKLFNKGADMVIACDADEFLIADPALGMTLPEFLSSLPDYPSHSGLGVDVLQDLQTERQMDFSMPFLSQRHIGWLHSRYTKPSVITRPLTWGGGYHRVKNTNFHIAKGLYLFHFGAADLESLKKISEDPNRVNNGWTRHQNKRLRNLETISRLSLRDWDKTVDKVRRMQTFCRPMFAPNKPTTFGLKFVAEIPGRFDKMV